MTKLQQYRFQIDQLPPEIVEAVSPVDAACKVGRLIDEHDALQRLDDGEPVEINARTASLGAAI